MAGVCREVKLGAATGAYTVDVAATDSNVVLNGAHGVNGVIKDKWLNTDLFNKKAAFTVAATERHQIVVNALFTQNATDTSKVTVRVLQGDQDVIDPCVLTASGKTMAVMSVITPA